LQDDAEPWGVFEEIKDKKFTNFNDVRKPIEKTFRNSTETDLLILFAPLRQTMQKMHNLRTKGLP
jgi:hypothetical protein